MLFVLYFPQHWLFPHLFRCNQTFYCFIVEHIYISEQRNSENSKLCSFWQLLTKYMPELPVSVCFKHKVLHLKSIRHLISLWIPTESTCDTRRRRSLRSCLIFPIGYTFIPLPLQPTTPSNPAQIRCSAFNTLLSEESEEFRIWRNFGSRAQTSFIQRLSVITNK